MDRLIFGILVVGILLGIASIWYRINRSRNAVTMSKATLPEGRATNNMDLLELHRSLRDKKFRMSLPKIVVASQQGEPAFEGTGFVSQNDKGLFKLDLMVVAKDTRWIIDANPFVPNDEPSSYRFNAIDADGLEWSQGEYFRPRLNPFSAFTCHHRQQPFHLTVEVSAIHLLDPTKVTSGNIGKLDPNESRSEFVLPGIFDIPTPGRHITDIDSSVKGKSKQISFDHYEDVYEDNRFVITQHRDDGVLIGSVVGSKEGFPPFADQKVKELLMYFSASVFDYSVLVREGMNQNIVRLRGSPPASSSHLPRPVEQDDFWVAFGDSIRYLMVHDEENPGFHPIFSTALDVMSAGFGTKSNHDVALSVGIEAALSKCGLADANPDGSDLVSKETSAVIQSHVSNLELPDGLHARISGLLGSLRSWRAPDRLYRLRDLGHVNEQQIKAWKKIRNPTAHGLGAKMTDEDYGHLYTLLNAIVLISVGSHVKAVNYAQVWKTKGRK